MGDAYRRPPIIEAVIEFRASKAISATAINKLRVRLKSLFPQSQENHNYDVSVNFETGKAQVSANIIGQRLSNSEAVDLRIINQSSLLISRLPPYTGWDAFAKDARRDWHDWCDVAPSNRKLDRIGVRFLNRIDIPMRGRLMIDLDEYFTFGIRVPQPPLNALISHTTQIQSSASSSDVECGVNINFSSVPSPLIDHQSMMLDIDVFKERDIPSESDELWEIVRNIRIIKNLVFEACITDATRDLFK